MWCDLLRPKHALRKGRKCRNCLRWGRSNSDEPWGGGGEESEGKTSRGDPHRKRFSAPPLTFIHSHPPPNHFSYEFPSGDPPPRTVFVGSPKIISKRSSSRALLSGMVRHPPHIAQPRTIGIHSSRLLWVGEMASICFPRVLSLKGRRPRVVQLRLAVAPEALLGTCPQRFGSRLALT